MTDTCMSVKETKNLDETRLFLFRCACFSKITVGDILEPALQVLQSTINILVAKSTLASISCFVLLTAEMVGGCHHEIMVVIDLKKRKSSLTSFCK